MTRTDVLKRINEALAPKYGEMLLVDRRIKRIEGATALQSEKQTKALSGLESTIGEHKKAHEGQILALFAEVKKMVEQLDKNDLILASQISEGLQAIRENLDTTNKNQTDNSEKRFTDLQSQLGTFADRRKAEVRVINKKIGELKQTSAALDVSVQGVESRLSQRLGESLKVAEIRSQEQEASHQKALTALKTDIAKRGGGAAHRLLANNGTILAAKYSDLNFIGSGITITAVNNNVTKRTDITLTATGIGATILSTTGTIDDSNVAFPFVSLPTVIVINGATYQQTGGAITWTWNTSTLTATLSAPVGLGGSIFGIS